MGCYRVAPRQAAIKRPLMKIKSPGRGGGGVRLAEYLRNVFKGVELDPQHLLNWPVISARGRSKDHGHPLLSRKFEASLGYRRAPSPKTGKQSI